LEQKSAIPQRHTNRPAVPFEGKTTSGEDFKEWPLEKRATPSRPAYQRSPVKFDDSTEAKDAYQQRPVERPSVAIPIRYNRPAVPFEGTTTSHDDYKEWPLEARKHAETRPQWRAAQDDRDFRTQTQAEFTEKPIDICPAALLGPPPAKAAKPEAWADGHVLYDRQHHRWAGQ
jgi:hypothetical protein